MRISSVFQPARFALIAASLLLLPSCADLFSSSPPVKPPSKVALPDAAKFVRSLSVASISLEKGDSLADIASEAKTIEAFSKRKTKKPAALSVVIFDYEGKTGEHQAVTSTEGKNGLDAASDVLSRLESASFALEEVKVRNVSVTSGEGMKLTGETDAVNKLLHARLLGIARSAHKLAALEDARMQIKLLQHFTQKRHRDAAYICADNAKRLLSAAYKGSDKLEAEALAQELSVAEGALRKAMPY